MSPLMAKWLLFISLLSAHVGRGGLPEDPCDGAAASAPLPEPVRVLVVGQWAAEDALRRISMPDYRGVMMRPRFVRTDLGLGGLEVYCAENTAVSHGGSVLVGFMAGRAFALGGFQAVELVDAVAATGVRLDPSGLGDSTLLAHLVLWADPNGGTARTLEGSSGDDNTPVMPAILSPDGTRVALRCVVAVSIRSGWARSQEKSRYCFAFGPDGALSGWARHSLQ